MNLFKYLRVQWDRTGAAVSLALAALCFVFGWIGVGNTPFTAQQIPYVVSGGLGGILFLTVAAVLWLSADLRDEWRKLDAIERHLEGTASVATPVRNGNPTVVTVEPSPEVFRSAQPATR
jgi:hypothetical protein